MEPRLIYRTHYQVDEPTIAARIVTHCTSPVVSSYDETVAVKLSSHMRANGKEFNVPAARYAVDLAHKLQLINANNIWAENGHLVNLVTRNRPDTKLDDVTFSIGEQLLHFRLFLEADGAALLFLARRLLSNQVLPSQGMHWNAIARELFVSIYTSYLAITNPIADRVSLRSRIDRLSSQEFSGKSGAHKLFLHLQVLHRLGLVERVANKGERIYRVTEGSGVRLERMTGLISDVFVLENIVKEHSYIEVAAQVYGLKHAYDAPDANDIVSKLLVMYRRVAETGVPICPLAPIVEATQISLLVEGSSMVEYGEVIRVLREFQGQNARDIRFHQDRRGNPAFLRVSENLLHSLVPTPPAP